MSVRSPFRQSVRYEEVGLPVTEGVHTHHPVQAGGDDLLAPENHQSEQAQVCRVLPMDGYGGAFGAEQSKPSFSA